MKIIRVGDGHARRLRDVLAFDPHDVAESLVGPGEASGLRLDLCNAHGGLLEGGAE
jgi:hypothetical protein